MKRLQILAISLAVWCGAVPSASADASTNIPDFRARFFQLCDRAAAKVRNANSKGPYFVDSYAVRALCVAYDMTAKKEYLDACRNWSDRMVQHQNDMSPSGAYYMHYNRKPGETKGDWYAADSSSIGMAVVATGVRCDKADRRRYFDSARKFADLVISSYIKPDGGVSDGLWHQSSDAWWCSSGLFGSFSFCLYSVTGDERYLTAGLDATKWLNGWDLTKDQPFPLSQQGPAMLMYVMECYSAGWPYIQKDESIRAGAEAKVAWCIDWITHQQSLPISARQWPPTKGWGMKFGGLPFHEYVFASRLPNGGQLTAAGDAEMRRMEVVFDKDPSLTQLPMFMLMSYAERLDPGGIYRAVR